jgi:hypothetical protein
MEPVLQASLGGWIARTASGRLHCHRPGWFMSGLILLALLVSSGGVVAAVLLSLARPTIWPALGAALPAALFATYWSVLLRIRWRRMGSFLIDVHGGTLLHFRGLQEVERWPLHAIRFSTVWDPFHSGGGIHRWIIARVPDGRGLRLGKGTAAENAPVLRVLTEWGLRVEDRV